MSDPCTPCGSADPEDLCDESPANTTQCDTICDERYRSLSKSDYISLLGTMAPNGKCLYKLKPSVGFVVSDANGQRVSKSACNILEGIPISEKFPHLVVEDDDGCLKKMPEPNDGYTSIILSDGLGKWKVGRPSELGTCHDLIAMVDQPIPTGTMAFISTNGNYGMCIQRFATGAEGYIKISASGQPTIEAVPVIPPSQSDLPDPPVTAPEDYVLHGDGVWRLAYANRVISHHDSSAVGIGAEVVLVLAWPAKVVIDARVGILPVVGTYNIKGNNTTIGVEDQWHWPILINGVSVSTLHSADMQASVLEGASNSAHYVANLAAGSYTITIGDTFDGLGGVGTDGDTGISQKPTVDGSDIRVVAHRIDSSEV